MANMWFYTKPGANEKFGPVTEDEFRRLISSGQINEASLVWTEGMENWKPLSALWPWSGPAPTATSAVAPPITPPTGMIGWMTFLGIVHVAFGILGILSCFGAINGILMLVAGVVLLNARAVLQMASPDWPAFLTKLNTFFAVSGVMFILAIVGFIIGLVFFFSAFANALSQIMN